jgi:hypothetical protein
VVRHRDGCAVVHVDDRAHGRPPRGALAHTLAGGTDAVQLRVFPHGLGCVPGCLGGHLLLVLYLSAMRHMLVRPPFDPATYVTVVASLPWRAHLSLAAGAAIGWLVPLHAAASASAPAGVAVALVCGARPACPVEV